MKNIFKKNKELLSLLLILFISSLLLIIIRSHSYGEPVEFNSAEYSLVANEILKGKHLYSKADINLPGHFPIIYYIYSIFIFLGGMNENTITTIGIFFSIITLISIGILCYRSFNLRITAITTFSFAIFSSDIFLYGNQPSIELVLNSFLALSLLFLLDFIKIKNNWKLFISSSLIVLSIITKPVTILFLIFLIMFIIFKKDNIKIKLLNLGIIFSSLILFILAFCLLFFLFKIWDFDIFIKRTIGFSVNYAMNPFKRLPLFFVYLKYTKGTASLWLISFFYLIYKNIYKKEINSIIILSFFFCSLIGLTLPGTYLAYYYYLPFPYIIIGTGIFVNDFIEKILKINIDKEFKTTIITLIIGVTFIPSLYFQFNYYLLRNQNQISEIKYGNIFITIKEFSSYINSISKPEDKIFIWGQDAGIFFYSKRKPVDDYFYFYTFKDINKRNQQIINLRKNLQVEKPELIIIGRYYTPPELEVPFLKELIEKEYSKIFENTQYNVYRKN